MPGWVRALMDGQEPEVREKVRAIARRARVLRVCSWFITEDHYRLYLVAASYRVPLDWDALLGFPDEVFIEDVLGIARHVNVLTGALVGFHPSCVAGVEETQALLR